MCCLRQARDSAGSQTASEHPSGLDVKLTLKAFQPGEWGRGAGIVEFASSTGGLQLCVRVEVVEGRGEGLTNALDSWH